MPPHYPLNDSGKGGRVTTQALANSDQPHLEEGRHSLRPCSRDSPLPNGFLRHMKTGTHRSLPKAFSSTVSWELAVVSTTDPGDLSRPFIIGGGDLSS